MQLIECVSLLKGVKMISIDSEYLRQCQNGFEFKIGECDAEIVKSGGHHLVKVYTSKDIPQSYHHKNFENITNASVDKEQFEEHIVNQIKDVIPGVYLVVKDSVDYLSVEYRLENNGEWWDEMAPIKLDPIPWLDNYVITVKEIV